MTEDRLERFWQLSKLFSKPHPWHGIRIGATAPEQLTVFIEIVPGDTMKYELDKDSGYLKVDRPQRFSNICPLPYGLVPQTLCTDRVAEICMDKTGREGIVGDGDPLDICVATERNIPHGNIIMEAIPIGGLRMIDGEEADDKIVAVMKGDALYGDYRDIHEFPDTLLDRLRHYFLTYKEMPDKPSMRCEITHIYGAEEAYEVIRRSQKDYQGRFYDVKRKLVDLIKTTGTGTKEMR